MNQADTDAPSVTYPHPYGPRVLITTEGLEEKPVLYIPDGAATRSGLERGIVLAVGEGQDFQPPPFTPGCVVQFHAQHGTQIAGNSPHLKLINFECIMAWEDA